jgi:uncharacterized protein YegJ (DUF2314 family)
MNLKIRAVVIVIAVLIGIISAKNKADRRARVDPNNRNIVDPGDDPRFKAAEAEAKRRWPEFAAAFNAKKPGDIFIVKARFTQGRNEEWMWVKVGTITGGTISGTLADEPSYIRTLKEGQAVTVQVSDTDDWMYHRADGTEMGGFTDKVLQQIEREQK